ncbi:hypothetical protein [Skermania piniformis]|uniref:hypothetical protein n=1 Tax=Skermania pinensis TaxID=39122 RepID=UPI001FE30980|nr:hypothetical protein [Skermania piniformis]
MCWQEKSRQPGTLVVGKNDIGVVAPAISGPAYDVFCKFEAARGAAQRCSNDPRDAIEFVRPEFDFVAETSEFVEAVR